MVQCGCVFHSTGKFLPVWQFGSRRAEWPWRRQFRSDCGKEIPIHGTETAYFPCGILQRIQSPAVPDPECYYNRFGRRGLNQFHCAALTTDSVCVEIALLKTAGRAKGSAAWQLSLARDHIRITRT